MQISDSHIGFDKPANTDVTATLRAAIAKIKAEPEQPSFVLHTGDLTHLSKPAEFDTLQQVLSELSLPVFYVPGEHDVLEDDGKSYLQRFGKGTRRRGLAQLRSAAACTSSASSTSSTSRLAGSARSATSSSNGSRTTSSA